MERKGLSVLTFYFFPVKCLAKFGSATTQRSEVALKPLLCLKMKKKQDINSSELQLYAVIETKKIIIIKKIIQQLQQSQQHCCVVHSGMGLIALRFIFGQTSLLQQG